METASSRLLAKWLSTFATNPIAAMVECNDDIVSSYETTRDVNCSSIALITQFIRAVRRSPALLGELHALPFFRDDPRIPRAVSVSAGRTVLGVFETRGPNYEKARSYGQVAAHFVDVEIEPHEIAALLVAEGVKNFHDRVLRARAEAVEPAASPELANDNRAGVENPNAGPPRPITDGRAEINNVIAQARSERGQSAPRRPKLDLKRMLQVECPEHFMALVLAADEHDEVTVKLRVRTTSVPRWKSVRIEDIIYNDWGQHEVD